MDSVFKRVALWFALVAGLTAAGLAVMVVVSIVGRAGWSEPIQGDVELMQMGVALAISLALPWCQVQRANIIVDFFTQNLPQRRSRTLDGLGALMLAVMCGLLAWRAAMGAVAVRQASETTMILGLPMWWAYAMLAPGLALTALIALWQAARWLRGLDGPGGVGDGVAPAAAADVPGVRP